MRDGVVTTVAEGDFDRVAINNDAEVAFVDIIGVFRGDGGTVTTIVDAQADPLIDSTLGPLTINEAGVVAFRASRSDGTKVLITGSGGPLNTVVDTSSPFFGVGKPNVNDVSGFAFMASFADGTSGILTGPDPVADRVIGSGDMLFGLLVAAVDIRDGALNNSGQIVFFASLGGGVEGIYVATPVPEPGGSVLLVVGGVALLGFGCRQMRNRRRARFGEHVSTPRGETR